MSSSLHIFHFLSTFPKEFLMGTLHLSVEILARELISFCKVQKRLQQTNTKPNCHFANKSSHYICRFATASMHINYIPLYQYKGNSEMFLVGCSAKVTSLNSHENGVLAGYFFKNSKYVYNPPTYIKGAFFGKVRGQIQIFKVYLHSSLSFNSRGSNQNLRQDLKMFIPLLM